ncbi:hypothetical protein GP486_000446 [Trichoglossum hirsutum]|uniref:Uncharacterized protein n=1 Tax=Trichoglossum hirsutum TaxID=265104 RepID=A0A9P8LIZ7_9PEZI|nr:hypothetical protein GP486_000446 [Trichoglossum hirsutum]
MKSYFCVSLLSLLSLAHAKPIDQPGAARGLVNILSFDSAPSSGPVKVHGYFNSRLPTDGTGVGGAANCTSDYKIWPEKNKNWPDNNSGCLSLDKGQTMYSVYIETPKGYSCAISYFKDANCKMHTAHDASNIVTPGCHTEAASGGFMGFTTKCTSVTLPSPDNPAGSLNASAPGDDPAGSTPGEDPTGNTPEGSPTGATQANPTGITPATPTGATQVNPTGITPAAPTGNSPTEFPTKGTPADDAIPPPTAPVGIPDSQ